MARLYICLLEAMIDISDEQFGTNIKLSAALVAYQHYLQIQMECELSIMQ
jgi:fructose/tagatose bisphosphate aldolase